MGRFGRASFLDHTIAYEALGEGCPSTALAFNMHASVVMPLLESAEVSAETKRRIADLVVQQGKLIAGNFSEPVTTSLIGERPLKARARRADGGHLVLGSYTPVYLGVAQAAFDELRRVVHARQPEGYAQPLAYHPDVRRHVAEMSDDLRP